MKSKIKIGISSCLLGKKVRYDGRDKREPAIIESLADQFDLVPVCPELEAGMTIPREAVRLVQVPNRLSVIGHSSGKDWTDPILACCRERVNQIQKDDLCGYILKSGSPSCGTQNVPIYSPINNEEVSTAGVGLFAEAIRKNFPDLPVRDEIWLRNKRNREKFRTDVIQYSRFKVG